MSSTATHVWRPSVSRVIMIDGFVPGPRGMPLRPSGPLQWPPKDPGDILDYQFDVAPALTGNDGDSISNFEVVISPSDAGDLSLASTAADGSRAVLWLQGGQVGTTYSITLTIATQAGRTLSRTVLLPVVALATQSGSGSLLTTDTGSALVDDSGNALELDGGT